MTDIVHVENLVKRYDDLIALDHFNLNIAPGEIFGLLGPNGSGKTTSINCILQLLAYDKGTIELFGEPMTPTRYDLKRRIGVVPQQVAVFDELTVRENIDYFCSLYVNDRKRRRALVDEAIDFVGLGDFAKFRPGKLSGGLARRLNIACGLAHKPELIFFDEPTVAVDPQSRNAILEGICRLRDEGATVVYTSHYMEEVEQICSRIMIMDGGRVLAQGTNDELKRMIQMGERVTVEVGAVEPVTVERLRALEHVLSVELSGGELVCTCEASPHNLVDILDTLRAADVALGRVWSEPPTLNDVFLEITGRELRDSGAAMFNTIITTLKTLLRRPSTWVWGAIFPIALSTMFMFMFANLSSDGKVDPVPVAVVADEAWGASSFKDVATSLAKEGDDRLLEIHECEDVTAANRALKAGEVAGIYTVDAAGTPKLTLLSSYDSSRASTVLTDRSILETVASSYTQNAELMSKIAQDNPAALADPATVARALSLEGGTRRVSLTRTTPDGTTIYYYALFGLVAMMSAEFAALSVVDLQPNLSGLGARRCVGGLSKTASLAGIFVGSWLVSFASMAVAIGYVRLVVGVDFGGREGLCLVGGAVSALAATGLGLFVGTLPVKGGKASKSGILTGFATTCALFAGLYGEPAMALADDVARACPAECWLNPVKLICDMFNRLYFFEDLGPFAVRAGALVLMALVFVAAATLIFGRSRYEHL